MESNFWQEHQNFNPHSQEGSDIHPNGQAVYELNFNPHSQEGSDGVELPIYHGTSISIHTPKKGVTAILPNFRLYIL
mgnify:CR=1 FL=1